MVMVEGTLETLPAVSCDWMLITAEQAPAGRVCAGGRKATRVGTAAPMVSTWVPLVRPVDAAVTVGEPMVVSLKRKRVKPPLAAIDTEVIGVAQLVSLSAKKVIVAA